MKHEVRQTGRREAQVERQIFSHSYSFRADLINTHTTSPAVQRERNERLSLLPLSCHIESALMGEEGSGLGRRLRARRRATKDHSARVSPPVGQSGVTELGRGPLLAFKC